MGPEGPSTVKSIRDVYGPNGYLFANSSKDIVYVRRGLSRDDAAVETLGSSAKWQLLANLADDDKLRGDICNMTERDRNPRMGFKK